MKSFNNLSYKQRATITLAGALAVFIFILYFFVISYIKRVEIANKMLIENRVEFETNIIKEEKLSKISKSLSEIEPNLKYINDTFINEDKKLEFITMLEGLAEKHLVNLEIKIDFTDIKQKNKSNILNLNTSGSYTNLMSFLVSLENLDYYININNISISSGRATTGRALMPDSLTTNRNLTMNIIANTYWQ